MTDKKGVYNNEYEVRQMVSFRTGEVLLEYKVKKYSLAYIRLLKDKRLNSIKRFVGALSSWGDVPKEFTDLPCFEKWSVDKITLNFSCIKDCYVQELFDSLMSVKAVNVMHWATGQLTMCEHNFKVVCPGGAVLYLGLFPNSIFNHDIRKHTIVLEYNPNKVNLKVISHLIGLLKTDIINCKVRKLDLAYDINYNINDIIINKRHGNEYFCNIGHSSVETVYRGDKVKNDFPVKVYNKGLERNVDSIDWTRYEITMKLRSSVYDIVNNFHCPCSSDKDKYNKYIDYFCSIFENCKLEKREVLEVSKELGVKGTDLVLLKACLEHREYLKDLDKRKRSKIKEYIDLISLENDYEIPLDKKEMYYCIKDYLSNLFDI